MTAAQGLACMIMVGYPVSREDGYSNPIGCGCGVWSTCAGSKLRCHNPHPSLSRSYTRWQIIPGSGDAIISIVENLDPDDALFFIRIGGIEYLIKYTIRQLLRYFIGVL